MVSKLHDYTDPEVDLKMTNGEGLTKKICIYF